MRYDAGPRPGVAPLVCGAVFIALSAARVATGWVAGPGWPLPEIGSCAAGTALGLWGWSRLRRAKAARPELTWWQFLGTDLIALGIGVVLLAAFATLTPAQREGLVRSVLEFAELVSIARGRL